VKQLTLFRQRMVLMSRREQWCCFSHLSDRIRSSPSVVALLLGRGVLPVAGVLFCVGAPDRCALVVPGEFPGVAAGEILVRDCLD
jgi:hypothetical protein